jgi:thiol-disulfide isomerase/thioredoxin
MAARRFRVFAAALALAGAAAIAVAGVLVAGDARAPEKQSTTTADGDSASVAGARAPRLDGTDPLTGERVRVRRGKPVLVTVWASWCAACAKAAPALARFVGRHGDAAVVGLDYQDTSTGARAAYREWGWEHPSIADPDGRLAARLGVATMPTTFVYNRDLRLVTRLEGPQSLRRLEAALRRARRAS